MQIKIIESAIQQAFFQYVRIKAQTDDRYNHIFAVPNERMGIVAGARMKAAGQKKGVSDIVIAYPSRSYPAAFIELKRKGGKASPEQVNWLKRMATAGYFAVLHETDDWQTLAKLVDDYFAG
jgi:hypothetical protein